ncbi:AAA family ATPase [Deinococcus sp. SDU3-2]|uniref:AAA family ATPase n=1 Tax=Deinococcus terrestris TaxID=2651870 RepID=A0A7X1NXM8_9DEIO|nr:AAA family ATPase [Deinococcus terrestris]MPY67697.1 AAA family ATPase [Deinococcus terrestris]
MSEVSATTGFLSLVMEAAGQGLGVREALQDILGRVSPEMFQGEERRYAESARKLLDLRQMPTPFAIAKDCGASPMELARLKLAGAGLYGDLAAAAEGVRTQYHQRRLQEGLTAALAAAQKGQLDLAQTLTQELAEQALLGEAMSLEDYHDFDPEAAPEPRHLQTTLATLNEDLGGGLAAGGALCLSLVAAPSGVGKSTFAFQQVARWLTEDPHWVLYCSGEMPAGYVFDQVTRLVARQSEDQRRYRLPVHHRAFVRAAEQVKARVGQGRFTVYDGDLSPEAVLELARRKQKELTAARLSGQATEDARLVVIVDNWDNLFTSYEFGELREDQVFGRWMQRFQRQAAEYGYHHMNLSQTSGEAEDMKEPAHAHQMQGSRKLHSKASHVITLYRPRDSGAVERALRESGGEPPPWAHPMIGVRKARGGGRTGVRRYRLDEKTGAWRDAEAVPEF